MDNFHELEWFQLRGNYYRLLANRKSVILITPINYRIDKYAKHYGYLISLEHEEWIGCRVMTVRRLSENNGHSPVILSLVCRSDPDIFECLEIVREDLPVILFCRHTFIRFGLNDGREIHKLLVDAGEI